MADTRFQLCDFSLDGSLQSARVHIERERAIGVYDLLEDNRFIPVGHDGGPYHLADELPPELVYAGFSFGVCRHRSLYRHGPEPAEPCSSTLSSQSVAAGRTASRSRFTEWTTTRSGRRGDIDAAREIEGAELFL